MTPANEQESDHVTVLAAAVQEVTNGPLALPMSMVYRRQIAWFILFSGQVMSAANRAGPAHRMHAMKRSVKRLRQGGQALVVEVVVTFQPTNQRCEFFSIPVSRQFPLPAAVRRVWASGPYLQHG